MLRISNRGLVYASALIVTLLVANAVTSYHNASSLRAEAVNVERSHAIVDSIFEARSAIKDAETGQRGYLLTGDPGYLRPYHEGVETIAERLAELDTLLQDQVEQSRQMPALKQSVRAKLDELQQSIELFDTAGFATARERVVNGKDKQTMDEIRSITNAMKEYELDQLALRSKEANRAFEVAISRSTAVTLLGILAFAGAVLLTRSNITARTRATAALSEQMRLLRTTVASINEGIVITDAAGRVVLLNRVAEQMTGPGLEQVANSPIGTVLDVRVEDTETPADNLALEALNTGAVRKASDRRILVGKDDRKYAIEESAAPLFDDDGKIIGAVLAIRDVTEQRRTEREIAEARIYAEGIVDTIPDPLVILDRSLHVRSGNLACFTIFKTTEAAAVGASLFALGGAAWNEVPVRELMKAIESGGTDVRTIEVDQVVPDLGPRRLRLSARRLRGAGEHAQLMLLAIRDVTDSRANERRIQQLLQTEQRNAERLRHVAAASLTLNSAHSREGVLTVLRQEAKRILDREEAVVTLDRSRSISEAEALTAPLLGRGGETIGLVQVYGSGRSETSVNESDETILQQLALVASVAIENARLYEELRDGDRRKDEFLATLAHELRNPLAPIRNSIQILRAPRASERDRELATATIDRQVTLLVRLVDDLLDVSRITRGKVVLKWENVDLGEIVGQAIEVSRPIVSASGNTLSVKLPQEKVVVFVDPSRIAQVLSNLLNNAAKYTERGGHIWLSCTVEHDEVLIRVRDDGIGIPDTMLPRIFDMFWQLDRALERAQGGLGIGLTLVRQLVELHGGRVEARSRGLGQGSEFIVGLPYHPHASPPALIAPIATDDADTSGLLGFKILVVDDNHDSAESLALLLRLGGHEVRTAHDGVEALEVEEAFCPAIVLLDIGLPRMDGHEVARVLRTRRGKDITLVAMTGWGKDDDRRRSADAGFDQHLVKPVDPQLLHKILAERRARSS
jgi:PAS domain S-box-containing protein